MRETRLKLGKIYYERGEVGHPYAVEYADTLPARSGKPSASKEAKKEGDKPPVYVSDKDKKDGKDDNC